MRFLNAAIAGLLLGLLPALAAAQGVAYRWVDSNGVVHFSDQPPPEPVDAYIFPLPEYEPPAPPTPEELALQARVRQINARIEQLIDEREAERAARARAEAAALRAQLARARAESRNRYQPIVRRGWVHSIWRPPFTPIHPQPPVDPPMRYNRADSAFDRLYNSIAR